MCLKPQAVPERGKKTACFNVGQTWGLLHCLSLLMFAADLSECTLLNPFWHLYSTIYVINCFNQTSLSWRYDYLPGAWNFVNSVICKRASQVIGFGFGSFWGQTGWPCSKHGSQRQKLLRSSWNWNLVKPNLRICVAGCFNWREGDPALVSVTLHSHITLSPVTCHPIRCRANKRVADCATVWVCKCLQLIYLSALHLTLFDIYRIYGKI